MCASCHTADGVEIGGRLAPPRASLAALSPDLIYQAISTGRMKDYATTLDEPARRSLAAFVASRPSLDTAHTGVEIMTNRCAANPPLPALSASPAWNGWGGSTNARFQDARGAGLKAADVSRLKLKWAFGLPGGGISVSQPTVAFGRVFVGSDNRAVYSIDATTGCAYWAFHADTTGRFAPVVGEIAGHPGSTHAVYFVTEDGTAYAIDAHGGRLLWKTPVTGVHRVSTSAALYGGRLYIPLAGTEVFIGSNPSYECCRSRGGVVALDANTGRIVWKVDTIPEPLRKIGENQNGTAMWGPAGASVWNVPTVDPKRHRIYVGTGNNFGRVASSTSDSILALDMDTGRIVWHHQEFSGDAFMGGCGPTNDPKGNCPATLGPDWDFGGASAMLQTRADGKDVIVAAGKGGIAIALDPDAGGKLLWRTTLYDTGAAPKASGLVLFGGAADGARAYFPLQRPGGGLAAVRLDTGALEWTAALDTDKRGQAGAASAIPGAVFTGGWDGILRAVDGAGRVIWSFNTNAPFTTINGVQAKGGSLGPPGATIANGMVYVASGYIGIQAGTPGNVVLAFAVER